MVASSGKRSRPERSHSATMATIKSSPSGSTTVWRAAMTSYSVVVTRVGASAVLSASVGDISLRCMGDLPVVLGVACAVPYTIDIDREEQKACQTSQETSQSARQGACHAARSPRKTRRGVRHTCLAKEGHTTNLT